LVSLLAPSGEVVWRETIALQISTHFDFQIDKARGKSPLMSVADATFGQHFLAAWTAQRLFTDAVR